jgi:hypothetical protein
MSQINLQDILVQGDAVTLVWSDTSTISGVFQSWREGFRYMVITEGLNTLLIPDNYSYASVVTPI